MSKPRTKSIPHPKPFIKNDKLEIHATHSGGKITGFKARKGDKHKEFPVKKHDILAAWTELENWLGTL